MSNTPYFCPESCQLVIPPEWDGERSGLGNIVLALLGEQKEHSEPGIGDKLLADAKAKGFGSEPVMGSSLDIVTLQAVGVASWFDEPDEPDRPVINGLFDVGDRVAIVGQSKARKSFYTLQLAIALSFGVDFLGSTLTAQRVLLINGEIAARSYKKRLRRMLKIMGINPEHPDNLLIANTSEFRQEITFSSVMALAKEQKATVCIIDPAYLLLGDEIDQRQVKEAVLDMKRFAAEGITLVSVFHATKGKIGDKQAIDRISGSGIFARDTATLITLCEHANEPDHVVISAITRNYPPSEPITAYFNDGAFQITDVAPIEKTSSTRSKRVISLDEAIKPFTRESLCYSEAVDAIKKSCGCSDVPAKKLLTAMTEKGMLFKIQVGRKTLYSLIEKDSV